jgi:hypothetical protein
MEPLDQDFDHLCAALVESAKRWAGEDAGGLDDDVKVWELDNFASMLCARLQYDKKHMGSIDLTIPLEQLLMDASLGLGPVSSGVLADHFVVSPVNSSGAPQPPAPAPVMDGGGRPGELAVLGHHVDNNLQRMVGGSGSSVQAQSHLDDVLAQMTMSQPESMDARLVKWDKDEAKVME